MKLKRLVLKEKMQSQLNYIKKTKFLYLSLKNTSAGYLLTVKL